MVLPAILGAETRILSLNITIFLPKTTLKSYQNRISIFKKQALTLSLEQLTIGLSVQIFELLRLIIVPSWSPPSHGFH
jgi:hypothetical protein